MGANIWVCWLGSKSGYYSVYRERLIDYVNLRDAGNFAAEVVAQSSGIEPVVQYGFGANNLTGSSKPCTFALTVGIGLVTRENPASALGAAYLIGKHGEDKLSQRSIDIAKEFIRRRK